MPLIMSLLCPCTGSAVIILTAFVSSKYINSGPEINFSDRLFLTAYRVMTSTTKTGFSDNKLMRLVVSESSLKTFLSGHTVRLVN